MQNCSILQQEGRIDDVTVTHQDYTETRGERYPTKKLKDSEIIHGDGTFVSETSNAADYTPKQGERHKVVRPKESDIWKVNGLW